MDSLYSKSEETFTRSLISSVLVDRQLVALARVSRAVLSAPAIPPRLRPALLQRALVLLRRIERERSLLDLCFARRVPHPACAQRAAALGELWELPREQEWLCADCGTPLYCIENTDP